MKNKKLFYKLKKSYHTMKSFIARHSLFINALLIIHCSLLIGCENPFFAEIFKDLNFVVTDAKQIEAYLGKRKGGMTPDNPVDLQIDLILNRENWLNILSAIESSGKYVYLDLSKCKPGEETTDPFCINEEETPDGEKIELLLFKPREEEPQYYEDASGIVSLIIPDTAEEIGKSSFLYFYNLRNVAGKNILSIDEKAFYENTNLQSFDFPKVKNIGEYAFQSTGLRSVTIPASCIHIGDYAFECEYLTIVIFEGKEIDFSDESFPYHEIPSLLDSFDSAIDDNLSPPYVFEWNGDAWQIQP